MEAFLMERFFFMFYGVKQYTGDCQEVRYIFEETAIREQLAKQNIDIIKLRKSREGDGGFDGVDDVIGWPRGGEKVDLVSTSFSLMHSEEDIKKFLTTPSYCFWKDPALYHIRDYLCTIGSAEGDCTRAWCDKLGINPMEVAVVTDQEGHYSRMWQMINDLRKVGVEIDIQQTDDNPIPKDEEMRFSQLEEMWQERCNNWGFIMR